jgi:genome maintenance exonuclease 1
VALEKLKRITTEKGRIYQTPDGQAYPSVTTVLSQLSKKAIIEWRHRVGEKQAKKITTKASRRGTSVHKMCEDYLENKLSEEKIMPSDNFLFIQLKDIIKSKINNIRALEAPLYSHYLKCAGTVDCIAEYNNVLSIIDFKTSMKVKKEEWISNYFMQESAYAVMWEERVKEPITQLVTLIANDTNEPQVFIQHRDQWIHKFINVRQQYEEQNA